jgi:hypothetical protein
MPRFGQENKPVLLFQRVVPPLLCNGNTIENKNDVTDIELLYIQLHY